MPAQTIVLDPVTRIEGHLRVDLDIEDGVIVSARSSGTSFRGLEPILVGRDPRDACHITQRICGVCPTPHARASTAAFEMAAQVEVPLQGRLLRNLIEAANFVDSHILHFYVLSLPDFVSGLPTAASGWGVGQPLRTWDNRKGIDAERLGQHVVQSLAIRRDCHAIGSLLGGKLPHTVGIVPGGATGYVTQELKTQLATIASRIRAFVDGIYRSDVEAVALAFPEYLDIGASRCNFLSLGGYPQLSGALLLSPGLVREPLGESSPVVADASRITESVASSRYVADVPRSPAQGATVPDPNRVDAYSWVKAPRYEGLVCEVGPLARSVVAGIAPAYRGVFARHLARVAESVLLASNLPGWIDALEVGAPPCVALPAVPDSGQGVAGVEAPRGALGHWLSIVGGSIANYQVISPTTWNGSPRDEAQEPGPMERALEGVAVADPNDPIEALRIIHSLDPCLQCSVH